MTIKCRYDYNGTSIGKSLNIDYLYCQPDLFISMIDTDFESLPNYQDSIQHTVCHGMATYPPLIGGTYPCGSNYVVMAPVDFFTSFNLKPGYVEHPSFSTFEEYFVMSQDQIDIFVNNFDTIAFFFVAFTMMAAYIKGFNTGMNS